MECPTIVHSSPMLFCTLSPDGTAVHALGLDGQVLQNAQCNISEVRYTRTPVSDSLSWPSELKSVEPFLLPGTGRNINHALSF